MKYGSLNLLEHSGPHRACYGTAKTYIILQCESECFRSCNRAIKIHNETFIAIKIITTQSFKKSATVSKGDLHLLKIGQYKNNLTSRIEFVASVSYKFLPNTDFGPLSLAFSITLATCISLLPR